MAAYGVAVWSSAAGRAQAVAWLDGRLDRAGIERTGIERTGEIEQPHLRPWATLLTAPTTRGPVWLKATGPATAFEVGLYGLLHETVPQRVLDPISADGDRGWVPASRRRRGGPRAERTRRCGTSSQAGLASLPGGRTR